MKLWVEHYLELYPTQNVVSDGMLDDIIQRPTMEELDEEPTVEELTKVITVSPMANLKEVESL